VLRRGDGASEMFVSEDFPLCTNPAWLDQQQLLVEEVFINRGVVLSQQARKPLTGALVAPIKAFGNNDYSDAKVSKWAKAAATYAVLRAKNEIIGAALPECELPVGMWKAIRPATLIHLTPLRQHWTDVVRCQSALQTLLGKVRAAYATLPLEFTDGRIMLVNPKDERAVREARQELANRRSSLPVYPTDVDAPLSYDSDDEDEGLADARANGEDKGAVLEIDDDDDGEDDDEEDEEDGGDDENSSADDDPMEGVEEQRPAPVVIKKRKQDAEEEMEMDYDD
jgi:hypothetical protein